jgi:hypothetical protein
MDDITNLINFLTDSIKSTNITECDNIRIYITNNPINNYNISNDNKYTDDIKKKLQNNKQIKYTLKREHYYSQIRDIDVIRKREKCYIIEEKTLNTFNINKFRFIINSYDIYNQNLNSFPDLHKYHENIDIDKFEYIFDNMKLIIENNNIFIDLKKNYNVEELKKILRLLI